MATRKTTPPSPKTPAAKTPRTTLTRSSAPAVSDARLDELIEEATTDAHDPEEQFMGFHSCIEDSLAVPFETIVLGALVRVTAVEDTGRGELVAVCQRGKYTQRISLGELPLPDPPPAGYEWILAYRQWARRQ